MDSALHTEVGVKLRTFVDCFSPGAIEQNEVHVCFFPVRDATEEFWELLSEDEKHRARRIRVEGHRNNFILARGWLRTLIGSYVQQSPKQLRFSYSHYGKPCLDIEAPSAKLRFNVSHSDDLLVLAFAWNRSVGVDVERVRKEINFLEIAMRYFSPGEQNQILRLPAALRTTAFFHCWTQKEAYLKASGEGFCHPSQQFDVVADPASGAGLLRTFPDHAEAARWQLIGLLAPADYQAALAVSVDPQPTCTRPAFSSTASSFSPSAQYQ